MIKMKTLVIKGLKNIKSENWSKLNELLRFYDGFDNLVEFLYTKVQKTLGNTLENYNNITEKQNYIYIK